MKECCCGWEGGGYRYCDAHNPCFPTTPAGGRGGEATPLTLFDVVCELDALSDWLKDQGYWDASELIKAASKDLTSRVTLRLTESHDE